MSTYIITPGLYRKIHFLQKWSLIPFLHIFAKMELYDSAGNNR